MKTFIFVKSPKSVLIFFLLLLSSVPDTGSTQIQQWSSRGPGGGGALFSPSFSPHDPSEIYIACDMSELFKSTTLGESWNNVHFDEMTGNNGAKMQFTNNPQVMYCINFENDLMTPFKTTNGGINWSPLSVDPTSGETYSLNCDINNSNRIMISDYTTLYFSSNGGSSFTQKYTNPGGCYVAGVFFDNNVIYAGLDNGVLVSTNGGASFTMSSVTGIPGTEAIVSMAGAKNGGVTKFICVTLGSGDVYPGVTGADHYGYKNVYSIDWGQASWALKISGIAVDDHPFFAAMSKNNTSIAYVAGGNTSGEPIVYKTTNGGDNWNSIFLTNNNQNIFTGWSGDGGDRGWSYGEYALGFDCSPVDPNKVMITDLGFPHLTTNGGVTWKQSYLNSSDQNPLNTMITPGKYYSGIGLENTSCWWLSWSDSNNIFGGYSDIKGTRSTDAGISWSFNYTGNTFNTMYHCIRHSSNGNLYGAVSSVHDMYQSTYLTDARIDGGTGKILFSTNKGQAWQQLHDFAHPVIYLALDPNNSNRMYASVIHSTQGGIFVSSNIQNGNASTWTKLSNPPRTEGHPFNVRVLKDGTLLCSYSGRRNTSGAFTSSSGIFVSTNSGTNWIDRSHSGMLYWTKDVIIDPNDTSQNTWYACVFSGWGGPPNGLGGLYKTTNRGVNWTKINNLDRVESCAISPVDVDEMYLTTEVNGLWYSSNINSASPAFIKVSGYPFRQPERIFYNPNNTNEVWVTSFGNGIKVGNTILPPITLNLKIGIEGFWNGASQVQDTVRIQLRNPVSPYASVDSNKVYLNSAGSGTLDFSNAPSGNYYMMVKHRNALETWSNSTVAFSHGQNTSFDFTVSISMAYGNNQIFKSGRWCIYSGDAVHDGTIDLTDIVEAFNDAAVFTSGYVDSDFNGDSSVDLSDIVIAFNNSNNFVSLIRP